jgi:hypothetical protein
MPFRLACDLNNRSFHVVYSETVTLPPPHPHPYLQRLKKQKKLKHWPVSLAAAQQQKACGLSDYWPFINSIKLHRVQIKEGKSLASHFTPRKQRREF